MWQHMAVLEQVLQGVDLPMSRQAWAIAIETQQTCQCPRGYGYVILHTYIHTYSKTVTVSQDGRPRPRWQASAMDE